MKHLQFFNERKFYTIKYNDNELSIDDLQNGQWSITDHLNPKIDKIFVALTAIKTNINVKGARVYSDDAEKIDLMYDILNRDMDNINRPIDDVSSNDIGTVDPIYSENDNNSNSEKLAFIRGAISKYGDYSNINKDQLIEYIEKIIG
jgi:hypothetical protein